MADCAPIRNFFVPLSKKVDREFRDFCGPIWDVKRHGLSNPEWRRSSHLAAFIQPAVRAKDVDFGFCFKRPIKKCFGSQVAGSTHPDTRAMALAVSASGIVAGARFPRDALCVRRRAPEAAKVRFPRAKSSDTSRRRRTDARFPTTSGASIAPLRRRGDGDARRASFDKQRPADLEPPEPLGILSDILTPCLAFRARAGPFASVRGVGRAEPEWAALNKVKDIHPLPLSRDMLIWASLPLLPAWLIWGNPTSLNITWSSSISIVFLATLGGGAVFLIYIQLIRISGPTFASLSNYLVPLVGIILGIGAGNEQLHLSDIIATVVILAGLAMTQPTARANPHAGA